MKHTIVKFKGHGTMALGNCLYWMPRIKSTIDMVLCDLPYGTTKCSWDAIIPFDPLWDAYSKITKPKAAIVLTASQPFTSALVMSNPKWFRYSWIWEKNKGSGHLNANRMPMKYHEDICVFSSGATLYNAQETDNHKPMNFAINKQNNINGKHGSVISHGRTTRKPRSIIPFAVVNNDGSSDGGRIHPSQKPVSLFEYLIKTYTNKGERVLDNTIGSGTTAIAAINTGRRFIGFELQKDYFDMAVARIENHLNMRAR